jgi:hypothetical protein
MQRNLGTNQVQTPTLVELRMPLESLISMLTYSPDYTPDYSGYNTSHVQFRLVDPTDDLYFERF